MDYGLSTISGSISTYQSPSVALTINGEIIDVDPAVFIKQGIVAFVLAAMMLSLAMLERKQIEVRLRAKEPLDVPDPTSATA